MDGNRGILSCEWVGREVGGECGGGEGYECIACTIRVLALWWKWRHVDFMVVLLVWWVSACNENGVMVVSECVWLKRRYGGGSDTEGQVGPIPSKGRWGRDRPRIDRQEPVDAPLVAARGKWEWRVGVGGGEGMCTWMWVHNHARIWIYKIIPKIYIQISQTLRYISSSTRGSKQPNSPPKHALAYTRDERHINTNTEKMNDSSGVFCKSRDIYLDIIICMYYPENLHIYIQTPLTHPYTHVHIFI